MITTTADNLLREAGAALVLAGARLDLVLAIERHLGEPIARPEPLTEDAEAKRRRWCADMRRVAAVLEEAGRPLLSKEIAAAVWPGVGVWRCRGWLSNFFGLGWIDHATYGNGATANTYRLGRARDWQDFQPDDGIEGLRVALVEAQRKLAEATAARIGGAR